MENPTHHNNLNSNVRLTRHYKSSLGISNSIWKSLHKWFSQRRYNTCQIIFLFLWRKENPIISQLRDTLLNDEYLCPITTMLTLNIFNSKLYYLIDFLEYRKAS